MSGQKPKGRVIRARMETRASADAVWRAWADPEEIAHWFVDRAEGVAQEGRTWLTSSGAVGPDRRALRDFPSRRGQRLGPRPGLDRPRVGPVLR